MVEAEEDKLQKKLKVVINLQKAGTIKQTAQNKALVKIAILTRRQDLEKR